MEPNRQQNSSDQLKNIEYQGPAKGGMYSLFDRLGRHIGGCIAGWLVRGFVTGAVPAIFAGVTDWLTPQLVLPIMILLPALVVPIEAARSGDKHFPMYGIFLLSLALAGIVLLGYVEMHSIRGDNSNMDIWLWSGIACWLVLGILMAVTEFWRKRHKKG